jgi:hypothetical protein
MERNELGVPAGLLADWWAPGWCLFAEEYQFDEPAAPPGVGDLQDEDAPAGVNVKSCLFQRLSPRTSDHALAFEGAPAGENVILMIPVSADRQHLPPSDHHDAAAKVDHRVLGHPTSRKAIRRRYDY